HEQPRVSHTRRGESDRRSRKELIAKVLQSCRCAGRNRQRGRSSTNFAKLLPSLHTVTFRNLHLDNSLESTAASPAGAAMQVPPISERHDVPYDSSGLGAAQPSARGKLRRRI